MKFHRFGGGGASVIVGGVKPDGCDVKPVREVRRCELSAKPFVGTVAFRSLQSCAERGAVILNPPPHYCTDNNGQNGALVKSVLLLFHNCRPINLGGKTWASFCVFNGGVIILNRIKQPTPEQTVFTEMSIFRGGLFIYPRRAWTRFTQEPKLKNASPACQVSCFSVAISCCLLTRSAGWLFLPPTERTFCRWRLRISHSEGLSAAQSE